MPIEMVGGEVQPQRNPRTERRRRLELKAAHFDHVNRLRRRLVHLRAQRHADVSADEHVAPCGPQHPADERRRRRLPFRSGHRDHRPFDPAPRQLQLADRLDATGPRAVEHRLLERDAGTRRRSDRRPPASTRDGRPSPARLPAGAGDRPARTPTATRSASRAHLAAPAVPPPRSRCGRRRRRPRAVH